MKKEMYCISCPNGCLLTVELDEQGNFKSVSGELCPKGVTYAENEIANPQRMLTSIVSVSGSDQPMLPVISNKVLPKGLVEDAIKSLRKVHVEAPVEAGNVIVQDILGTGVDMIAASSIPARH